MFHISAKVWPFYQIYQISPFDKFIIQPIWENSKAIFLLSFTYFLTTGWKKKTLQFFHRLKFGHKITESKSNTLFSDHS